MNIFHVIVLGIVEGITEFLPVSSTFHLIFAAKFLGIPQNDFEKLFEIVIQAGAILSVLLLYIKDLLVDRKLLLKVIAAFIPTAIVGFALEKVIKAVFFESEALMLTAFFVVGLVFIILEYVLKNDKVALTKEVPNMTLKEALIIGVVQSLAVLPGVSRAGSVIVGMIFLKYKRTDAARFSFLLSIPTIFAASFLELFKMRDTLMSNSNNLMLLIVGCVVAFISSYIVVKWFINYLKNHSLEIFGWYRVLLVIIILLFIYFRVI